MRFTVCFPFVIAIPLGACVSGPKVDATSQAACRSSLAAVTAKAAKSKDSTAYAATLLRLTAPIAMHSVGTSFGSVFNSLGGQASASVDAPEPDTTIIAAALCDGLNGSTAHEIALNGDSLAPRVTRAFDKRFARAYIEKLTAAKAAAGLVRDSLAAFRVESAGLVQATGFMGLESTIVLTVVNGTTHSISRAFFSATAISEGREIPWLQETFNHSIPGGLAPGEKANWRLTPNMFSGNWNKVRVPKDAHFIVEPIKLNGVGDEPLWGGATFTVGDQKRLDSLTAATRAK
jgi:hypothetical protein